MYVMLQFVDHKLVVRWMLSMLLRVMMMNRIVELLLRLQHDGWWWLFE